jgi:hypothetical protein
MERKSCGICGREMIIIRRVTRTTQVCPFSTNESHKHARRMARLAREIENIERHIGRQS